MSFILLASFFAIRSAISGSSTIPMEIPNSASGNCTNLSAQYMYVIQPVGRNDAKNDPTSILI